MTPQSRILFCGVVLLGFVVGCRATASPRPSPTTAVDVVAPAAKRTDLSDPKEESSTMTSRPLTVTGVLEKRRTVGYRSPYRLVITERESIRKARKVSSTDGPPVYLTVNGLYADLEPWLGKTIVVVGNWVVHEAQQAEPGSEAAMRFIDGMIPSMSYLEVEEIRSGDTPQ